MVNLRILGRAFFGFGIAAIGALHFFFPGIRPIVIPGLADASMNIVGFLIGLLLVVTGILIAVGYKYSVLSLVMGIVFLILGLAIHLPAFLNEGRAYWVNLNKVFALSGGFLMASNFHKATIPGKYLFALMLFLFGIGHLQYSESLASLIASSSVLKTAIGSVGPKVSSCMPRISLVTPVITVGS